MRHKIPDILAIATQVYLALHPPGSTLSNNMPTTTKHNKEQSYEQWELDLPGHDRQMLVRVLVMIIDTSLSAMKDAYKFERQMTVPSDTKEEMAKKGLIELTAGDYIFVQDLDLHKSSKEPAEQAEDDVLAVAVAGCNHHDPNAIEEFNAAMEAIVGSGKGGLTDFKREKGAKKINGNRCFSLATTYEKM
ncbi:hypothetical protein H1R20_g11565, partial [Candolleomyces eurysporus]